MCDDCPTVYSQVERDQYPSDLVRLFDSMEHALHLAPRLNKKIHQCPGCGEPEKNQNAAKLNQSGQALMSLMFRQLESRKTGQVASCLPQPFTGEREPLREAQLPGPDHAIA